MVSIEKIEKIAEIKDNIKSALIEKGCNPSNVFNSYADDIRSLGTGGSDKKNYVLGVTCYKPDEEKSYYGYYNLNGEQIDWYTRTVLIPDTDVNTSFDLTVWYSQSKITDVYISSDLSQGKSFYVNLDPCGSINKIHLGSQLNDYIWDYFGINVNYDSQFVCNENDYNIINWLNDQGYQYTTTQESYQYKDGVYLITEEDTRNLMHYVNDQNVAYSYPTTLVDLSGRVPIKRIKFSKYTKDLILIPDTSDVTNMADMFYYCKQLSKLDLSSFNTSNVTNMYQMFYEISLNYSDLDISNFDTSKVTDMNSMFAYSHLKSLKLPEGFGKNCANMSSMFFYTQINDLKIENIDWSSMTSYPSNFLYMVSRVRYLVIKNLGKATNAEVFNMSDDSLQDWGDYSEENKQSLIDTLVTYSYDRAASGLPVCTINLHPKTFRRLTDEHIAQITAKGYTIA